MSEQKKTTKYLAKFTFVIPVEVESDFEDMVDAYYAAKEQFPNFTLNEAEIKIESVSDEEWNARKAEVDRLHQI